MYAIVDLRHELRPTTAVTKKHVDSLVRKGVVTAVDKDDNVEFILTNEFKEEK